MTIANTLAQVGFRARRIEPDHGEVVAKEQP
jgi:hypothetical protein